MKNEEYLNELLSLPEICFPLVSKNKKWIAWTWFQTAPAGEIFVCPTDGSAPPVRLSDTQHDTYLISWLPDSSGLIVAQDKNGNERDQLFRIDINQPLVLHPLTEPEPDYYIRGGELHPNNQWLIYGANFNFDTKKEIEPTWIYRHNLLTNERKVIGRPQKGGYISPDLSPDGNYVLYNRNDQHPAGQQIWLVDIKGKKDREIINLGADVKIKASWFPDSKNILVLAEKNTYKRIGIWNLSNEKLEWIIDNPKRNIERAYFPKESNEIVIIEVAGARNHASLFNLETKKERKFEIDAGNIIPIAPYENDEWICLYNSSCHPDDIIRILPSTTDPDFKISISRVQNRSSLLPADFCKAENYHWTSSDGLKIQGWLYQPKIQPKGTIVLVHGGPTAHSKDIIYSNIQFFVKLGFVVFNPNYRGSTGFGLPFRDAIKKDGWGGLEQEDIRAGITALINDGIATPGKIGITGTSYGGYSAWHAITHFSTETIAAAAPICGMTDLIADYETTRPDLRPYSEEMLGGTPSQVPDKYFERSPINFVKNIKGNLLIIQGAQDPNVTPENVRLVRCELDKIGIPYDILIFDNEGHGISKTENRKILYRKLIKFFSNSFSEL